MYPFINLLLFKAFSLIYIYLFFFNDDISLTVHIDGKFGTGKSITLTHILHYAFAKQMIIVHVPSRM